MLGQIPLRWGRVVCLRRKLAIVKRRQGTTIRNQISGTEFSTSNTNCIDDIKMCERGVVEESSCGGSEDGGWEINEDGTMRKLVGAACII
jgi:hypothetical protein